MNLICIRYNPLNEDRAIGGATMPCPVEGEIVFVTSDDGKGYITLKGYETDDHCTYERWYNKKDFAEISFLSEAVEESNKQTIKEPQFV